VKPLVDAPAKITAWIAVALQALQLGGVFELTPEQQEAITAALLGMIGIFLRRDLDPMIRVRINSWTDLFDSKTKVTGWITVVLQLLQLSGAVMLTPEQHQAATAALLSLAGIFLGFGIEKARRNNPQWSLGGRR